MPQDGPTQDAASSSPQPPQDLKQETETASPTPAAKPRRRRRWPYVIGGILLLLLILVLLIPTIASTGLVRNMVVGQINKQLKGRVEIGDWSISWGSGIRVSGVHVYDSNGSQVAQIDSMSTQLPLTSAIRGNLALGETVVRGVDFNFTQYPDGTTTLDRLVKPSQDQSASSELPKLSGHLKLEDAHGTFTRLTGDAETSHLLKMPVIAGEVTIPDINSPIDSRLSVQAGVDNGPLGTFTVAGTTSVIASQKVNLDAANVDQTITLQGFSGTSIAAFVTPAVLREFAGVWSGQVAIKIVNGKSIKLNGGLAGKDVVAASAGFASGERYRSPQVTITIPQTTISAPDGLTKASSGTLKIGNGTSDAVKIIGEGLELSIIGEAPLAALQSPGAHLGSVNGSIRQTLSTDLAKLVKQLPQTLHMRPDLVIDSGRLEQSAAFVISGGIAKPSLGLHIVDVKGRVQQPGGGARRPVTLDPIEVSLGAASLRSTADVPEARDVTLSIKSGFANGQFSGPTLLSLQGELSSDLEKLRQQVGQFVDLSGNPIQGQLQITASSKATPDPRFPVPPTDLSFVVTVTNFNDGGLLGGKRPIIEPRIKLGFTSRMTRDAKGQDLYEKTRLALLTGPESAPSIDLEFLAEQILTIPNADTTAPVRREIPQFAISRGGINVKQLRDEFGPLFPIPTDLDLSGNIAISGGGSYTGNQFSFDGRVAASGITGTRTLSLASSGPASAVKHTVRVIDAYSLTVDLGATYARDAAGNATIRLPKLEIQDNQSLASLKQLNAMLVSMPAGGQPYAVGALSVSVNIGRINEILKAAGATPEQIIAVMTGQKKEVTLRRGVVAGTLNLSERQDKSWAFALDGNVTDLTVVDSAPGAVPVISGEKMTLTVRAAISGNFAAASLDQFDAKGDLATITSKGHFRLKNGNGTDAPPLSPLAMVQRFTAQVVAPDLKKVQAILDLLPQSSPAAPAALGPPRPMELAAADKKSALAAAAAATQPALPPPAKFAGGNLTLSIDAAGQGSELSVTTDLQAKQLLLTVGAVSHSLGDLTLKGKAAIRSTPVVAAAPAPSPATQPSLMDQIEELRVTELGGSGIGATLALKQPLIVKNLGALPALLSPATQPAARPASPPASVAGAVSINGQIEPLMQLQNVLAGKPATSAYTGAYSLDETITTENGLMRLAGGGAINDFISRDAKGVTQFSEKTVRLANNLSLDTSGSGAVDLQQFQFAFVTSGALSLDAKGRITDLAGKRNFEKLTLGVSYDLEPLWKIIHPYLLEPGTPPDKDAYKDWVLKGKSTRTFALSGSYPAANEAGGAADFGYSIRFVRASGSFGFDQIDAEGLQIRPSVAGQQAELFIDLRDGILRTADLNREAGKQFAAEWACNGGTMNLNGIAVNLTGPAMTLTIPSNTQVLKNVQLTPALANAVGNFINNPALVKPGGTEGVLNLTVVNCTDVPLGAAAKKHDPENQGHAEVTYSMGAVQLGAESWSGVAKFIGLDMGSLRGAVKDGRAIYDRGWVSHDMTLALAEQGKEIRFNGKTDLATSTMQPFTMFLTPSLFGNSEELAKYLPKGLSVALTGPYTSPHYDLQASFKEGIKQNLSIQKPEDIANLLERFGGKKKDDKKKGSDGKGGAGTKPAAAATKPSVDTAVDALGNLLNRPKKDREKEKQDNKK